MKKYLRFAGIFAVVVLWALLAIIAWIKPADAISNTERRKLDQFPTLSVKTLEDGSFMTNFESYTQDQFPVRDGFRMLKSVFQYYCLGQADNNGIYIAQGVAAKLEYPLNENSLTNAIGHFNRIHDTYLSDCGKIFFATVPDKGYYLAEGMGYPRMDYEQLFARLEQELPWAEHLDLTDVLNAGSYYRTDTHWRQEMLIPAAQRICAALETEVPEESDYTLTEIDVPFYGVYYGQAALPMAADTICLLENDLLTSCTVYNHETGKTTSVYDMEKRTSRDLYDLFLSGATPLLTIENPRGEQGRELIVFRDSFGSSMIPLLIGAYEKVIVVDSRYIAPELLGEYVEFHGQDVLFLYSTLILNNSMALK